MILAGNGYTPIFRKPLLHAIFPIQLSTVNSWDSALPPLLYLPQGESQAWQIKAHSNRGRCRLALNIFFLAG